MVPKADEWFLIAGQDLPPEAHYEDYPQIGNGVGSIRQFLKQFKIAARRLPKSVSPPRRWVWVVGNAVEQAFQPILKRLNEVEGLSVEMVALRSDYWGQAITVTGLLTGHDLALALSERDLGDGVLLPSLMLKHGDTRFLDDTTVADLEKRLKTPVYVVSGIEGLLETAVRAPVLAAR